MILERENFNQLKEQVKEEICCSIPSTITEIREDAFKDWLNLKYVYIPDTVSVVDSNAFCWDTIKIVFVDLKRTKLLSMPRNVKFLPITGNEESLFETLKEVMDFKKNLEFDSEKIKNTDAALNNLLQTFLESNEKRTEVAKKNQDSIEKALKQLNDFSMSTESLANEVLSKLDSVITTHLENETKKRVEKLEQITDQKLDTLEQSYTKIKKSLDDLQTTMEDCQDVSGKLKSLRETIEKELNKQVDSLKENAQTIIKELEQEYNQSKEEVLDKVITDATERLIQINPCKTIIVNVPEKKDKFQAKDLFHKEFDTVLKLVLTKKPILLKGPAGSGKNVIIEQIAKLLDLQFRYLNDVTDEFKVTGFVDANGNYIQTQFFKAFTEGGIMFVDEIDSSSPSALLAINAAIGTGYNHYMSFPDGNFYHAHDDFYLVAAANTFGTGADMIYSGRQALDGASLNRFIPVVIDYDRELERNLIKHTEILPLFWKIREIIQNNTIRHVISTRNIVNASELLDREFNLEDIFDWTIIQGLDVNDLNIISSRMDSTDSFSEKFQKHLQKKYQISKPL